MRFLRVLGFGLARLRRHPRLVLVPYACSLLPALAIAWLAGAGFAAAFDHSLFARRALAGDALAVWMQTTTPGYELYPVLRTTLLAVLVLTVSQVFLAGGMIETLLEREARHQAPFAFGMAKHARGFGLLFFWTVALSGLLIVGLGLALAALGPWLQGIFQSRPGTGMALALLAAWLVIAPLQLAFDLARVANASHGGRRRLRGLLAALGHTLAHPLTLWPAHAACLALALLPALAWSALLATGLPESTAEIAVYFLLHQLVLLLAAAGKVLLLGAEVGYFQAIGEPGWTVAREKVPDTR